MEEQIAYIIMYKSSEKSVVWLFLTSSHYQDMGLFFKFNLWEVKMCLVCDFILPFQLNKLIIQMKLRMLWTPSEPL